MSQRLLRTSSGQEDTEGDRSSGFSAMQKLALVAGFATVVAGCRGEALDTIEDPAPNTANNAAASHESHKLCPTVYPWVQRHWVYDIPTDIRDIHQLVLEDISTAIYGLPEGYVMPRGLPDFLDEPKSGRSTYDYGSTLDLGQCESADTETKKDQSDSTEDTAVNRPWNTFDEQHSGFSTSPNESCRGIWLIDVYPNSFDPHKNEKTTIIYGLATMPKSEEGKLPYLPYTIAYGGNAGEILTPGGIVTATNAIGDKSYGTGRNNRWVDTNAGSLYPDDAKLSLRGYEATWDGKDKDGKILPNGTYPLTISVFGQECSAPTVNIVSSTFPEKP